MHPDDASSPDSPPRLPPPERFRTIWRVIRETHEEVGVLTDPADLAFSHVVHHRNPEGQPRTGESRWATGEGAFTLRDQGVVLAGLRLESGREFTFVKGTVSFGRDADLTIQTTTDGRRESRTVEPGHILKISGPLDVPRVSVERTQAREPAD